ncbi:MAG: aldo/keto reductase [Gammaproteobacteria bacterium]|nr:aldo/keto reductase [Gammaproteobacteria bacterium]
MNTHTLKRRLGPFTVTAIGLGCMELNHAYGVPPAPEAAERVLLTALELGVDYFDTAALYGFGANEELLGRVLAPHRDRFVLATKGGMSGVDGKRVIDGRPEAIRRNCEDSLRRLRTEIIDLYYLHRWDKKVPIADSVGAMAERVREGKVRAIGLSEVSAATLRKAQAVHPIAALQNEYSLWTRNPEIAALETCRQLGVTLVAFSPLGRGFLTGALREVSSLAPKDIRCAMPRFAPANYAVNLKLLDGYTALAEEAGCGPPQLALAWLLARGEHVLPIPGTTDVEHLRENLGAREVRLTPDLIARLDTLINPHSVAGARYNAATQAEIDSEEF